MVKQDINVPAVNIKTKKNAVKSKGKTAPVVVATDDEAALKKQEAAELKAEADQKDEAEKKARKSAQKRRKLQKALRFDDKMFRSVLDSMDRGVAFHELITDDEGVPVDYQVREINPAFEDLVGLTVDEAVGKCASEIYGRGRPPYISRIFDALTAEETQTFDGSLRSTKAKLRFSVVPMGGKLFALMVDDISDVVRAESRVRARRTFLENKVKALSEANEKTSDTLSTTKSKMAADKTEAQSQNAALKKQVSELTAERNLLNKQLQSKQALLTKVHGQLDKTLDQLSEGLS